MINGLVSDLTTGVTYYENEYLLCFIEEVAFEECLMVFVLFQVGGLNGLKVSDNITHRHS